MPYKIIIADERIFLRDLEKIDKSLVDRIMEKIEDLATTGRDHAQAKRLKKYPVADYRLRVGDYRILFDFSIASWEIRILRVMHRSQLY